ncbi:MAG TPA: hypothetical protein VJC01_01425 [Candidatus Paceibacterota bacterium]
MISIKTKVIVVVLVVLAFIAIVIYFSYQNFLPITEQSLEQVLEKPAENVKPSVPVSLALKTETTFSGFKLYKNSEFGFEIQYPISWIVTEEINENIRGEMVKEFYFKKPNSDLRFAILPRDGLSYGVGAKGTSTPAYIGGSPGVQTQYILKDGRHLWLLFPQYGLYNWLQDLGRLDIMTSPEDIAGDTQIFEKMLFSFKLYK